MSGALVTDDELAVVEQQDQQDQQEQREQEERDEKIEEDPLYAEYENYQDEESSQKQIDTYHPPRTTDDPSYEAELEELERHDQEPNSAHAAADPTFERELEEVEQSTGAVAQTHAGQGREGLQATSAQAAATDRWNGNPPYSKQELEDYLKAGCSTDAVDEFFYQILQKADDCVTQAKAYSLDPVSPWNGSKPFTQKELNKALTSGKTETEFEVSEYRKQLAKQQKQGLIRKDEDIEGRVKVFEKKLEIQVQVDDFVSQYQRLIQDMENRSQYVRKCQSQEERDRYQAELSQTLTTVSRLYEEYERLIEAFNRVEEDFKQDEIDKKYQEMLKKRMEAATKPQNGAPKVRGFGQFASTAAQVVLENRRNYVATAFQDHRWFTLQSGSSTDVVPKAPRIRLPPPQDTLLNDPSKSKIEIENLVDTYHERLLEQIDSARIESPSVEEINLSYQSLGQDWQFDGFKKHLKSFTALKKLIITDNSIQTLRKIVLPELQVLIACRNEIPNFQELPDCPKLIELNLASNLIDAPSGLLRFPELKKLVLRRNPIAMKVGYRLEIFNAGPENLIEVDDYDKAASEKKHQEDIKMPGPTAPLTNQASCLIS
eukprot:TRINITY_DN6128_c0_g1_i1.p1 TRINITY_DN6128_c0_g1~~TRINITY_DN6128_c0_g1_i1.p1  ORF type:complete len:602 (-),score=141.56 TRINITY_DN6128_c0_g1_i1:249-2054(-)